MNLTSVFPWFSVRTAYTKLGKLVEQPAPCRTAKYSDD
jgi:hypothetical protein